MFARRLVPSLLLAAFAPIALGLGGCGGTTGQNAASHALKTPELPPDQGAKCRLAKSQAEPLIVEWPNAARGKLESVSRRGLVAVRYEGCELSVLARCTVKIKDSGYAYSPITVKHSRVTIKDADELYASMPVGAFKLEGKLQSAGQLDVQMTIVGRYESATHSVFRDDLEGDCSGATHVIAALTVGSFTFSAGSDAEVGSSAKLGNAGGGAKSTAAKETLTSDGVDSACERASVTDPRPPENCGALLQIEVMPLAKGKKVVVAPVPVPVPTPVPEPPPVDPLASGTSTAPLKPSGPTGPTKKPRCKKGERVEDGVCVKIGLKKPATRPSMASATLTCAAGQHPSNGRCVDDPPPEPVTPPAPAVPTCTAGSHLEGTMCVMDPPKPVEPTHEPPPVAAFVPPPEPTERPNPWRTVLGYSALGFLIAGSTAGYLALGASSTASDECSDGTRTCTQKGIDAGKTATTTAIIADVSFGLALLSIIGFAIVPATVKVGVTPTQNGAYAGAKWSFQ